MIITNMTTILLMPMFYSRTGESWKQIKYVLSMLLWAFIVIDCLSLYYRFGTDWEKGISFIAKIEELLGLEKNTLTNPR